MKPTRLRLTPTKVQEFRDHAHKLWTAHMEIPIEGDPASEGIRALATIAKYLADDLEVARRERDAYWRQLELARKHLEVLDHALNDAPPSEPLTLP